MSRFVLRDQNIGTTSVNVQGYFFIEVSFYIIFPKSSKGCWTHQFAPLMCLWPGAGGKTLAWHVAMDWHPTVSWGNNFMGLEKEDFLQQFPEVTENSPNSECLKDMAIHPSFPPFFFVS